jgi:SAM-dependent methyltransferase
VTDDSAVAEHFRRWPFPGIEHRSREGLILLRTIGAWLKASSGNGRVADIGCGTGQTVMTLARHFPDAEFLGIDLVEEVVEVGRGLAKEAQVENVRFLQADLNRPLAWVGEYDVVMCLGVLHHLHDLAWGVDSCCSLLGSRGHLLLWLYGRYGRERHRLNQQFLRLLGFNLSDSQRLDLAGALVEARAGQFVVNTGFYTPHGSGAEGASWLLDHPEWLADQMIPAVEQDVTLPDILSLFGDRSLLFEKWLGVDLDPRSYFTNPLLLDRLQQLSPEQRLAAIDLLIKPPYYFVAGRRAGEDE